MSTPLPESEICQICKHPRDNHDKGKTPPCEKGDGGPCFCMKFVPSPSGSAIPPCNRCLRGECTCENYAKAPPFKLPGPEEYHAENAPKQCDATCPADGSRCTEVGDHVAHRHKLPEGGFAHVMEGARRLFNSEPDKPVEYIAGTELNLKPDTLATKDSGARQAFDTGSVRDTREGKGRFDLITPIGLARLAQVYERGALKYGDRNWEKGQPISRYLDSAQRHIVQYLEGDRSEDHLAQAAWNLMSAMHTKTMIERGKLPPELYDLPDFKGDK